MSQNNDISSLLSSLDQANKQNKQAIFIPSLNREVNFTLLTAEQHKNILTTIMDQSNAGVSLSLLLNQIIIDNAEEKVSFSVLDKNYILVALRAYSLSNIYEHNNVKTDLLTVLSNKIPLKIQPLEIKETDYSINLEVPNLVKDSFINRETQRKIKEVKSDDNTSKVALDEIYTNEFIKYICSIQFLHNNTNTQIVFNDLNHSQKRNIVNKLSALTTTKILTEINKYKDLAQSFLTIDDNKIDIQFDQSFFTV